MCFKINTFLYLITYVLHTLGEEPVENWYSEIKDYDFKNPEFGSNTGEADFGNK